MSIYQKIKDALPELKEHCWNSDMPITAWRGLLYFDRKLSFKIRIQNLNSKIRCEYPNINDMNFKKLNVFGMNILEHFKDKETIVGEVLSINPEWITLDANAVYDLVKQAEDNLKFVYSDAFDYDAFCKVILDDASSIRWNVLIDDHIRRLNHIKPLSEATWKYIYDNYFYKLGDRLKTDLKMKFNPQEVSFKDYITSIGYDE